MAKVFMGVRLQRLREERRMTQVALAKSLGISPSYLNQMERNQRPLTVPILLRIGTVLGVDPQIFSEHDSASLVADVRDVFGELPDAPPTESRASTRGTPAANIVDRVRVQRAMVALRITSPKRWLSSLTNCVNCARVVGNCS